MPGGRSAEATQEIDPRDVLEVIDVARHSTPSLMKVGVDIEPVDVDPGRNDETCQIRYRSRRDELVKYVVGAVVVSCVILCASLLKRAPAEPHAVSPPASPVAVGAAVPTPVAGARATAAPTDIPPPPPPDDTLPKAAAPGSGSIRFLSPGKAAIWFDGKRLTSTSAIVSCGQHTVKVGWYPKHAVSVPCGGELALSR